MGESVIIMPDEVIEVQNGDNYDLSWCNVDYTVPVKQVDSNPIKALFKKPIIETKQILFKCTGQVQPGEMVAILGGSGAGKSTMLNVLAGRLSTGKPRGIITVNGQRRDENWKRLAAYVEQQDILYPTLTVKETITFAAMLKLPKSMSKEQKKVRVQETINMLGLGKVEKSRIGDAEHRGISGGEKKRVSIAIEMVTDPGILFLDEPTSGLDSFTAQTVTNKISEIAIKNQRTILLTIHQPRSQILSLFNKIILMSQGHIVYFGTLQGALAHFRANGLDCPEHENPADYFLDMITLDYRSPEAMAESSERIDLLIRAWEGSEMNDQVRKEMEKMIRKSCWVCETEQNWPVSICTEIGYLMQRYFRVQFRDVTAIVGQVMQTIIIALLLSFVFFQLQDNFGSVQSRIGLLFFIVVNQMFTIIIPLINVFTKDREIILRERYSATYRIFSAYVAKFFALLPLQFILTTVFCFMIYYITGLRTDGFQYFLIFYGFVLLTTLTAITLGLLVAASVPTTEIGQIVGPLIVVIFLIFGGNIANSEEITWILRWLQYVSPVFYAFQGLIQNELSGQVFEGGMTGDQYLEMFSLNEVSEVWCMGALLIIISAFFIGGFLAIRITTKPKTILI